MGKITVWVYFDVALDDVGCAVHGPYLETYLARTAGPTLLGIGEDAADSFVSDETIATFYRVTLHCYSDRVSGIHSFFKYGTCYSYLT